MVKLKGFLFRKVSVTENNILQFISVTRGDILKRFISVFLATIMLLSSVIMAFAKPVVKGDTNNDGQISARDARNILLYVAGKKVIDEDDKEVYDVDGSGFITAMDGRRVLRIIAGFDETPTEEPTIQEPATEVPEVEAPTIEATKPEETTEEERMMRLLETKFLELVNEERARVGVKLLEENEILHKGARLRAIECLEKFSHTRPNGESYKTIFQGELSYSYAHIGENIAWVYETSHSAADWTEILSDKDMIEYATYFFNTFKTSSVHYQNMIYSDFTETGFGVVIVLNSDGTLKVACSHIFGTPA